MDDRRHPGLHPLVYRTLDRGNGGRPGTVRREPATERYQDRGGFGATSRRPGWSERDPPAMSLDNRPWYRRHHCKLREMERRQARRQLWLTRGTIGALLVGATLLAAPLLG